VYVHSSSSVIISSSLRARAAVAADFEEESNSRQERGQGLMIDKRGENFYCRRVVSEMQGSSQEGAAALSFTSLPRNLRSCAPAALPLPHAVERLLVQRGFVGLVRR